MNTKHTSSKLVYIHCPWSSSASSTSIRRSITIVRTVCQTAWVALSTILHRKHLKSTLSSCLCTCYDRVFGSVEVSKSVSNGSSSSVIITSFPEVRDLIRTGRLGARVWLWFHTLVVDNWYALRVDGPYKLKSKITHLCLYNLVLNRLNQKEGKLLYHLNCVLPFYRAKPSPALIKRLYF